MNKKYIFNAIMQIGKTKSTAKHYLERNRDVPKIPPFALELEVKFGVPLEAWRDIKSYMSNHNAKNKELQDV